MDGLISNIKNCKATIPLIILLVSIAWFKTSDSTRHIKPVKINIEFPIECKANWKSNGKVENESNEDKHRMIDCYCPATGQYLGQYKSFTMDDIDATVNKSQVAFQDWKNSSFDRRLKILISLREFILKHQSEIASVACRDSGKTMIDASMGEILTTLEKLNWTIKHGRRILDKPSYRSGPTNFFMKFYKGSKIQYEPLGPIASIVSWNYPFHNLMGPVISAIITGNTIVVKCSEKVIWSSKFYINLIQKCLLSCNENPDIVQLCYCLPPNLPMDNAANYFTSHPGLKHITFIGSETVAHTILENTAKSMTPTVLELGGKDSLIILDSLPSNQLESLSSIILRGTFQSSGQNCIGIERVIVTSKYYKSLIKIITTRLETHPLKQSSDIDSLSSVDVGAMISSNRFKHLESLIDDAVKDGAKLLFGGKQYQNKLYPDGNYFEPTVLIDVTPSMKIANEEVFGPILVLMEAKNKADAINISNGSKFGLGNSVFGSREDGDFVANKLQSGNVAINDFATFYICQLPFGGTKSSGFGKFNGEEGLLGLCNAKSICYDKIPGIRTTIPPALDYPMKSKAWLFVENFITAAYTMNWYDFIMSLIGLAKNS
ncbi:hypothetical protein TBLA_0C03270 [Henningerozyma blattae CBS 6284]|uniref:Aldehyde dehydrogenase domain-containing protein n=1 Tax=Henningerozyma blattae (strain ATCC 34711 / CBS 6284 / DSM 70876 / NBRC 10599 / NRRL Y-10934 / UCD 77-7) TaxID=1071380 RepID=I2H179_HENB6|nr:hypothetical protein TBLA_0C03270 [Tetrapisispora blattae CBS 6284]CCH60131.1 hypothetical protein TBLA_0C03270 [Tetrapisispora blattae CBS 6284]